MKILFLGNYIYSRQKSMQRFANLMRELLTAAGRHVFMAISARQPSRPWRSAFPSQIDT